MMEQNWNRYLLAHALLEMKMNADSVQELMDDGIINCDSNLEEVIQNVHEFFRDQMAYLVSQPDGVPAKHVENVIAYIETVCEPEGRSGVANEISNYDRFSHQWAYIVDELIGKFDKEIIEWFGNQFAFTMLDASNNSERENDSYIYKLFAYSVNGFIIGAEGFNSLDVGAKHRTLENNKFHGGMTCRLDGASSSYNGNSWMPVPKEVKPHLKIVLEFESGEA